ncbi:MAG: prepilin-type N-terminal cleavage/methylation domain-containing protein [Planctomycetes bacterium]|nr:prepilin-type N-terminal cleavage/methylation domain-containing protein [Planctomycetota bacterium]
MIVDVRRPRGQAGFTMVEMTIVLVVLSVLSVMIVHSIKGLASTQTYTRGQARVLEIADRIAQDVARDVRFAVRAYVEDPDDRAFFNYLSLPKFMLSGTNRLPLISELGMFDVDPPDQRYTGNTLALVTTLPHITIDVSGDGSKNYKRVDTFQFLIYYVTIRADGRPDLGRWCSTPVASYSEIMSISNETQRARVIAKLAQEGCCCAWDQTKPADAAFYTLDASRGQMDLATASQKPVRQADDLSIRNMLADRHVEIAENGTGRVAVPKFARPESGFPHGFEIRIDGPGSGRLVLIRLVVSKRTGDRVTNSAQVLRIVPLRDV